MAKKSDNPASGADEPGSGTVRFPGHLFEMLQDIRFYARNDRGKRYKFTELVEELFGSIIAKKHREVVPRKE